MSRPHIEFIFSQNLDWTPASPSSRAALPAKILSRDGETGEATLILRVPPGYAEVITSTFDEELYVLDGTVTLDGQVLRRDGYALIPAGSTVSWGSDAGADLLLCLDEAAKSNTPGKLKVVDTLAMRWDRNGVSADLEFMGIGRKVLRSDPVTGAQRTFLLTTAPQNFPDGWEGKTETHPCVEECFMLAGDLTGRYGIMSAGAYFWRPPGIDHGPFGSRDGSLSLIRFCGGTHVNVWSETARPYVFDTPYRPEVPADFRGRLSQAYRGPERY